MKIFHFYGTTPQIYGIKRDEDFISANSSATHFWHWTLDRLADEYRHACEVHLLTTETKDKKMELGKIQVLFHPIVNLLLKKISHRFSTEFLKYLHKNPPDLFVFYGGLSFLSLIYVFFLLKWNIPYIVQHHGAPIGFSLSQRFIYRKAKAVIVLTEFIKERIAEQYKISPSKLFIVPCGINLDVYHPVSFSNNRDYPTLSFAGRFTREKGFLDVLECFRRVKEKFPSTILEVAGDYVAGNYKEKIDAFINRYSLRNSIIFQGWIEKKNEMRNFYNRADLFIFPSRSEGLPRVVLEAMACGTPVITNRNLPGCCEIIESGRNGVLVDLEQLDSRVLELLGDKERIIQMGERATKTVNERYSFIASYKKAKEIYLGFLQKKDNPHRPKYGIS